ncbi:MAG: FAD-dependent oxidoreductase, partial [Chloroflexi bacterium]|nr:FAD-dependent oxidoreductase [Chloroflexota bacterium]
IGSVLDCDVLVIGGGVAGVRAALAALEAGASVVLACKGPVARSGASPTAGGGFQTSMPEYDPRNNPDQHFADTMQQGQGLNEPALARALAGRAHERVMEADRFGADFERVEDGRFMVVHDPGCMYPRTLYTVTMRGLLTGMLKRAREHEAFTLMEDTFVLDLVSGGDRVVGALAWDLAWGRAVGIRSRATILATGGYQEVVPLASSS